MSIEEKNAIYIDCQESLNDFIQVTLSTSQTIALDTEFERRTTFFPKPALLQLHISEKTYLLDSLAIKDFELLFKSLSEKHIIMHACREDLEVFRMLSKYRLCHFTDTQVAASLLGYESQISYQKLIEKLIGKKLDKNETCSDWLKRPLNNNQLNYAIDDVLYLEEAYLLLIDDLVEKGRQHWLQEEMQFLYNLVEIPEEDDYFFKIKGLGKLDNLQLSFAYDLIVWRDQLAKEKNIPRGFIIKDKGLLEIIKSSRHQSVRKFYDLEDVPNGFVRKNENLLNMLLTQKNEHIKKQSAIERVSWHEPYESKQLKKHLKKERDKLSRELDIRPEVLLSNKMMSALSESIYFHKCYTDSDLIKIMLNWRYQLFKNSISEFF